MAWNEFYIIIDFLELKSTDNFSIVVQIMYKISIFSERNSV